VGKKTEGKEDGNRVISTRSAHKHFYLKKSLGPVVGMHRRPGSDEVATQAVFQVKNVSDNDYGVKKATSNLCK